MSPALLLSVALMMEGPIPTPRSLRWGNELWPGCMMDGVNVAPAGIRSPEYEDGGPQVSWWSMSHSMTWR